VNLYPIDGIAKLTSLSEEEIKYVSVVIMKSKVDKEKGITPAALMACLIYNMFKLVGFKSNDLTSTLSYFQEDLAKLADSYEEAKDGDQLEPESIQIWDNSIAVWRAKAFNFKEMEPQEITQTPVSFVGVVIPALYSLSVSALRPPLDQRSEAG